MIKKILKKYIPVKYFTFIRSSLNSFSFFNYVFYDYRHIFKFNLKNKTKISDIIRQYHRVEKSLSKTPFNPKRGYRAAFSLVLFLEKYAIENELKDIQFYVGLNVLEKFFKKNKDFKSDIYKRLKNLDKYKKDTKAGVEKTPKSFFLNNSNKSFETLAKLRKSIRYFSDKKVDANLIEKALEISKKTPSVCNRQGWHTWVIAKPSLIDHFRKIHNGFVDENQKLKTLLVMTFDKDFFDYPMERNQGFTDVGLYSMSVMYALTSLGLASCPLNSNLLLKHKINFKKIVGIPDNYTICMFIAVGNYLDENISPISFRYPAKNKSTFI